jgi:prepilin-type N-terminal cleavage/methylation domain-containing protein/prepilin-type processing-associated H-X9-DG protein
MIINKRNLKNGFTLVELLVVIAIIAVLVTISITSIFHFRKSADKTVALGSLRQLQIANTSYATENNGRFVPPQSDVDGVTYQWFENPEFVTWLKGSESTYSSSGTPDVTLPNTLMDPAVVRERGANYTSLEASYAYTVPIGGNALRQAQLRNPENSAVFITCGEPFVDHTTKSKIAYRHNERALVAFYDGHAKPIILSDITRIDSEGGANNVFWQATEAPEVPPEP